MKIKGIIFVVLAGLGWGTACLFVDALSRLGYNSIQMATAPVLVTADSDIFLPKRQKRADIIRRSSPRDMSVTRAEICLCATF